MNGEKELYMGMKAGWGATACWILWTSLYAMPQHEEKLYDVPEAMVTYKISGGGVLTPDVNLTLEGKGKLWFKRWGAVEFRERYVVERISGALHYISRDEMCRKRLQKQILDVDFKHRKIRERPLPKGKEIPDIKQGLSPSGQQMVGNVVCTMWEGDGIKHCIYKGIPLFTEYRVLGIYYREEAIDVSFDINVSEESNCSVPDYPVEKFALFTGNFKTDSKKRIKPFSVRLKEILEQLHKKGKSSEELSDKERKVLLEEIGEPVFEKQKVLLPKLLQTMKKSRACLVQADSTAVANQCLKSLAALKANFSDDILIRIEEWEKESKTVLERFDESIVSLQSKMKCIRGAKNLDDLSLCMQP
jgi:hypothetical protein